MTNFIVNHYVRAIMRWLWLIGLVTIVAAATGFVGSLLVRPVYRATATVMTGEDNTNPQIKTEDWVLSQRLASGYAALAKRQPILEASVKALGIQTDWRTVQDNVLVAPVANTNLLEIRVSDSDPQRASALANEIARQLLLQSPTSADLQQLSQRQAFTQTQLDTLQSNIQATQADLRAKQDALDRETSARAVMDLKDQIKADQTKITDWQVEYGKLLGNMPTRSAGTITIVESAAPPLHPVSPVTPMNVAIAALAGLVLSVGTVFLLEYLSTGKVHLQAEGANLPDDLRMLGSLPLNKPRDRKLGSGQTALFEPNGPIAEDFRVLRTNVRFLAGLAEPLTLLITSAGVREGKSTITANLAASFARAGKRTVVVDADLHNPSLHRIFGVANDDGLSTLLFDAEASRDPQSMAAGWLNAAVKDTTIPNLRVLAAGAPIASDAGELLSSPHLPLFIQKLREMADVLIFDTPPALPLADATILAAHEGINVVLVAASGATSTKSLEAVRELFDPTPARIIGVVVNKVPGLSRQPYYSRRDAAAADEGVDNSRRRLGLLLKK